MNRRAWTVGLALLALAALAVTDLGQANFNAATGFSGRNGFTCTSCHNVPPPGYPEATLVLEGIPESWEANGSYVLTVRIEGGPPALAGPAPQGGFEIEADHGTFSVPDGMADYVDVYEPGAVTYTAAGALLREWRVQWNAPTLEDRPAAVRIWAAGLAANGNHVVALGQADGGEYGDAVDNRSVAVPPSAAAVALWESLRLSVPDVDLPGPVQAGQAVVVSGTHTDPDATHLGYRLDDGPWQRQATNLGWSVQVQGLAPGEHLLLVRSESEVRRSDEVEVPITILAPDAPTDHRTPAPFVGPLLLLGALARRRSG